MNLSYVGILRYQKEAITISEFIKVTRFKANIKKSILFMYTGNEQPKNKIKKKDYTQ